MRRYSVILMTFAALAACGDNSNPGAPDVDANPAQPDANPAQPDADPSLPDAADSTPDAGVDAMPEPPPPPPPDPVVTTCERTIAAPTAGICDATAGTGTAVIVRGNVLGDGVAYVNGEVVYDGDLIVCAGCDCSTAAGYATATQIDCAGAAVSPGLINAHDHLNYNNKAPLASTARGGQRFDHRHGWRALNNTPAQSQTSATSSGMRWNELRQAMSGTTSMAASTRATGLVRNLDGLAPAEAALGLRRVEYEVFALGDGNRQRRTNCDWSYSFSEWHVMQMPALVTHTSEGIDDYAHDEFLCQSSSQGQARDFTEKNVAHIHGIGLTAADYLTMAKDGTKLIWSPRSNVSLYANTAEAQVFKRLGGTVALGTDWTYSGSATMNREMACAAYLDDTHFGNAFSDEEIWRMATINGAQATGTADKLGSLAAGKLADIAVFRAEAGQLHRAVINALTDDVALVVRDGDLLFAETDVSTALGQACDPVDVCGDERRVCASREFAGATFATIATAMTGASPAYPAIFCDTPAGEPTCVPSRVGAYDGPTEADPDGDGITAGDNCPTVFNPVRPMDKNGQPDADGDGTGDACDATPLGRDFDGDGRDNAADVCALASDDGTDGDSDGRPDACDDCDDQPNADHVCLPTVTTIAAMRAPLPRRTRVQTPSLTVVGVDGSGMYLQDASIASGEYAGVYGYVGDDPDVAVGDVVTVAGYFLVYFGLAEIENPALLARASGTPIAPLRLTAAAAVDTKYQGALVTITDVTKVDSPYVCTPDDASCNQPLLWEINDALVVHNKAWQGNEAQWTASIPPADGGGREVTGILSFSFNRARLLPRTPADIVTVPPPPPLRARPAR
jgi:large repetitive protein